MNVSTTFIVNPAAGSGNTKKMLPALTKIIYEHDRLAKIVLTRHPLHAISLARDSLKGGVGRIVVIGGDGTLNEVVNGFFDREGNPINKNAVLAIIASGTGSDFVRNFNHHKSLRTSVVFAMFSNGKPTDVGLVTAHDANGFLVKRYFMNVSSIGLSGLVAGFMKTVTRKFGSRAAYFLATVQAIRALKAPTLLLISEGAKTTLENCSLVSLANGKFFGSGMKIAPNADLDDGKLDVITVQDLGAMFFLKNGLRIYQGSHLSLSNVNAYQKSEVHIQALTKDPVYVEVDGELFAELPASFSILKHAILVAR